MGGDLAKNGWNGIFAKPHGIRVYGVRNFLIITNNY